MNEPTQKVIDAEIERIGALPCRNLKCEDCYLMGVQLEWARNQRDAESQRSVQLFLGKQRAEDSRNTWRNLCFVAVLAIGLVIAWFNR